MTPSPQGSAGRKENSFGVIFKPTKVELSNRSPLCTGFNSPDPARNKNQVIILK
jgi:hypothetical protein